MIKKIYSNLYHLPAIGLLTGLVYFFYNMWTDPLSKHFIMSTVNFFS
jgi:hypothetical protein